MASSDDVRGPRWFEATGRAAWLFIGMFGAAALIVVSVQWLSSIVIPLVLAAFLGAVFVPAVDWLAARRVPRSAGAALVVVGVFAIFAGALSLVVVGVVDKAPELSSQLDIAQEQLAELTDSWQLDSYLDQIRDAFQSGTATGGGGLGVGVVGSAVNSAVAFFTGLALGVILFYYLLRDGPSIIRSWADRARPGRSEAVSRISHSTVASVRGYVRGRTILAFVQAVAVGIGMLLLGVPLPFAIGVVTFITAYIPYLGALIGGAFAVLMALSEGGVTDAVWALAVVLFVNLVLENALEPAVQGASLNLHPIVVLLVTVLGGLVAGVVGLILASPIAAICRNLYGELTASGFFGSVPTSDRPAADDG